MSQTEFASFPRGEVPCSYHPNTMTGLRCGRCGKPICPQCMVRTPVGLRCPDCAGVRGLPTYRTPSGELAKALGAGLLVAVAVALLWMWIPTWQFYLCLLLGFGVVESMARFAGNKRGLDLQLAAMVLVTVGFVLARYLVAQRFGITIDDLQDGSAIVRNVGAQETFGFRPTVSEVLQFRLVPDLLFAAMAYAIAWVRFR